MPSEAQRHRLYQNALELFYSKGFKATTMRDIAGTMNFEAASLYNYFSSKDALLEELLFSVADQFLMGIQQIVDNDISHLDKIKEVIGLYVDITSENPFKAALLTTAWRNLKPEVLERFVDHRSTYEGYLRDILTAYYEEQQINHIDVEVALHTLLGSVRWICDWYIQYKGTIDPNQLKKQLINLIVNGMNPSNL